MTAYIVVVAPEAERDMYETFTWYRERNILAADSFRSEVSATIDRISEAPLARPEDDDGNRRRVIRHFPHSVIYEVLENTVTILAVAHHRRRPGYWRKSDL